ncbi:MAG: imidazole glycerol phosphate synthase subunit HisH [Gemmatimonadaceae bacterium]|jgi:glutamine amidotransferase|nr:imidazole glycerol phosphate synthase subunit HisH [Gemmatimonadaceae bacterium]
MDTPMRCTVFDYGAGNLHSLLKALEPVTGPVRVETDAALAVRDTDLLVLPGVGAFGLAAERLGAGREAMRAAILGGLPTLGICLGMQLFFRSSEEAPGAGLDLLPGKVTRLRAHRVPQIGWNTVDDVRDPAVADAPLPAVYYANGYACRPDDPSVVTAWTTHETDRFPAIIRQGTLVGVQFHPEKSSADGVAFVHAVVRGTAVTGAR